MGVYIIGDVHGCYDELTALLRKIAFNPDSDRLIFVGDLVNRGPKSEQVLAFVRSLDGIAEMVLGNHDISLLAYALGVYDGKGTDFPEIWQKTGHQSLIDWLRRQPLLLNLPEYQTIITHAGIPPRWSIKKAIKQAKKAEKRLQGEDVITYLQAAYEKRPDKWQSDYDKYDKFRYRINGFSRLRFCDRAGEPDFHEKGGLFLQNKDLIPWFELRAKQQQDADTRIIFGHWAALGYYQYGNVICLDSGCVWGNKLTAIALHKNKVQRIQVPAQ